MAGAARVVAVDLGASSGRVFQAEVGADRLELEESARFVNGGVRLGPRLYWDVLALHRGLVDGLGAAGRSGAVQSVGIDSWAVDYGLLRADGTLLDNPLHHRDRRTDAAVDAVGAVISAADLFARTAVAAQPFNTVYQLLADRDSGRLDGAAAALLVPDLLGYFLTGERGAELTNASTTGLLGVAGEWDRDLVATLGLPKGLLAPIRNPGDTLGRLRPEVMSDSGLTGEVPVTAVASHDTASAVVGVPAATPHFAYISSGTWSLVGVEVDTASTQENVRLAGFTNERGIDGTWRLLRNVMGLWLLQESLRTWALRGQRVDLAAVVGAAGDEPALRSVIDADDIAFLEPGDMPARLGEACRRSGYPEPATPPEVTRCVLDSLALAHRRAVEEAVALSGRAVPVVHLVGGGANNRLLCQLTADACGVPLVAGPVEAAAVGNALVQARSLGAIGGDRWDLRRHVAAHAVLEHYEPRAEMTARFAEVADGMRGSGGSTRPGIARSSER